MVKTQKTEEKKKEKNIIICLEQFRKNLLTTKSRELRSVFPKDKLQDNITKFIYLVRNKDNVLCWI